jgi:hypothetical protein
VRQRRRRPDPVGAGRERRRRGKPKPCPPCPPTQVVQVVEQVTEIVAAVGPKVVLIDPEKLVDPTKLTAIAAALAKETNEEFAKAPPVGHGIGVQYVRVATDTEPAQPDEWQMVFLSKPDVAGALGYHDRTLVGMPIMKIFPLLDRQDGVDESTTAFHELFETLKDPELSLCAQLPDGRIAAYEVCDGVEADSFTIDVDVNGQSVSVIASNWERPTYFEPPTSMQGLTFDRLGLCTKAFETRPGGYNQVWNGAQWIEIDAQVRASKRSVNGQPPTHSRRARRRQKLAAAA